MLPRRGGVDQSGSSIEIFSQPSVSSVCCERFGFISLSSCFIPQFAWINPFLLIHSIRFRWFRMACFFCRRLVPFIAAPWLSQWVNENTLCITQYPKKEYDHMTWYDNIYIYYVKLKVVCNCKNTCNNQYNTQYNCACYAFIACHYMTQKSFSERWHGTLAKLVSVFGIFSAESLQFQNTPRTRRRSRSNPRRYLVVLAPSLD